jgi:hypothetical protein
MVLLGTKVTIRVPSDEKEFDVEEEEEEEYAPASESFFLAPFDPFP